MFYKQIYGTVFLSVVSFFRILSPGKALADYVYLDRVFIAVLMISVAIEAIKSPGHLWMTLLIHESQESHAGIRQAEEWLEMAKSFQAKIWAIQAANTMLMGCPV